MDIANSSFVARPDVLAALLEALRRVPSVGPAPHRLIAGRRGMGKTSLLRHVAAGVRDDPALLPLTFPEEQYGVRTLDAFWRNCAEALAEWLEKAGDAAAARRIDSALTWMTWREPLGAAQSFLGLTAETGRRPLLLVDNLDLLLDALPEDRHRPLRDILEAPRGPILVGTATRRLGRSSALHRLFHIDTLAPLSEADLRRCLNLGDDGPERVRALHALTGGNPQVLALVRHYLADGDGPEALLERATPFYKARIEDLSAGQRVLIDAIALNWAPITAEDLAAAAGVTARTISARIARLRAAGLVAEAPVSGGGFHLAERLFNIWYLRRHGSRAARRRTDWLGALLGQVHSGRELRRQRARLAAAEPGAERNRQAAAVEAAIEAVDTRRFRFIRETLAEAGRLDEAEAALRQIVSSHPEDDGAWNALGCLLMDCCDRPEDAESAFLNAIKADAACPQTWINLGVLLAANLGRPEDAESAFREALRLAPDNLLALYNLGYVLANYLVKPDGVEAILRKILERDPNRVEAWEQLGNLLADHLNRPDEAEDAYQHAVALNSAYPVPTANMLWLRLASGRIADARELRPRLTGLAPVATLLIDAAFHVVEDDFAAATATLAAALTRDTRVGDLNFLDDLFRLLRLFERRGYGERLVAWFEETGHAEWIHAGFAAYVEGGATPPEADPQARRVHAWLSSWRRARPR